MNPDQGSVEDRVEQALFGSSEPPAAPPPEPALEVVAEEPQEEVVEVQPDDSEPEFQTIEDLAQALEVSPEDFASQTKVKVKVFDDERVVTLADLQAGYQKGEAFDEKKAGLSKEKADFAELRAQELENVQSMAEQTQAMAAMYKNVLMQEYNAIDWPALQRDDPVAFSQQYPAYQQRFSELTQIEQGASQYTQHVREERLRALIPVERPKMLSLIPEWNDPEALDQGKREVAALMQEYNLSDDIVIGAIHNAGAVKLLHDFAELKKSVQRTSAPKEEKKVVQTKTNIIKPGPRKTLSEKQRSRQERLKAKLRKTGNINDLSAVLEDRM